MRTLRIAGLLLGIAFLLWYDHYVRLAASLPPDGGDKLQGDWEVIDVRRSGITDTTPIGTTLTFARDQVSWKRPERDLDSSGTTYWTEAALSMPNLDLLAPVAQPLIGRY